MDNTLKLIEVINEVISTIIWPLVVLIVLFALKEPISHLIRRITKIGYDKAGIVAESPKIQSDAPEDTTLKKLSHEGIDKAIGIFNDETIKFFEDAVNRELKLSQDTTAEEKAGVLFKYSQVLYLMMYFNRVHVMIYGSQIRLLHALNGSEIENKDSLKVFYDSAKKNNPNAYENYSYNQYMEFLHRFGLIVFNEDDRINISILGRDFLKYMIETGLTQEKIN